jgi:tRNA pseudouridine55 synthase
MGHAGTLDPMATGLLIVLVRHATKLQDRFLNLEKEYEGVFRLGEVTASFDAETEVVERNDWTVASDADLDRARSRFVGPIVQQTPVYSAVKVGGERLYKKARRGEDVVTPKRSVTIEEFILTGRQGADISFKVRCSKGTYIRSLAHEFGDALGVGAHLIALRRTAIGTLSVNDAWQISDIESAVASPIREG